MMPLSEVSIEIRAEHAINRIDREYMIDANTMEEFEYKLRIMAVDIWADEMYKIRNQYWGKYDG